MSLFHKDPAPEDTKKREEWEKNLADAQARRDQGMVPDTSTVQPVVDQTSAEGRVTAQHRLGSHRSPDDAGGVHDGVNVQPSVPGQQTARPQSRSPKDQEGTVEQEIAVTTGPDGEVVDVHEVDTGSKRGKGKR